MRPINLNDYVHAQLIDHGLVPTERETFVIASIIYDFLIELGVMTDLDSTDSDDGYFEIYGD